MRIGLVLLLATLLSGSAEAQGRAGELMKPDGGSTIQWKNGGIVPGSSPDRGGSLWNNMAISAWWSGVNTGYINLDWGKLPVPSSGLPDHLIDGFIFSYGTNNCEFDMEEWAVYFFDSCTGWGNIGILESGFVFTGLPGVPWWPWYGWVWSIQVDLEGSGYEFLLDQDFGLGLSRLRTPLMGNTGAVVGDRPNAYGNGPTGTQNAFDIYYPNLKYNGSWWFGSNFWATWAAELFGTEGEADMTFYGVGTQGNDTGLYAAGSFSGGGSLLFLLRENETGLDGWLAASFQEMNHYLPNLDVTRLVGGFAAGFPMPMQNALGDFYFLKGTIPPQCSAYTIYFQGVLSDAPLQQPPLDASNGLRAN